MLVNFGEGDLLVNLLSSFGLGDLLEAKMLLSITAREGGVCLAELCCR